MSSEQTIAQEESIRSEYQSLSLTMREGHSIMCGVEACYALIHGGGGDVTDAVLKDCSGFGPDGKRRADSSCPLAVHRGKKRGGHGGFVWSG